MDADSNTRPSLNADSFFLVNGKNLNLKYFHMGHYGNLFVS